MRDVGAQIAMQGLEDAVMVPPTPALRMVIRDMGNGVDRVERVHPPPEGMAVPDLDYPLPHRLADLARAVGLHADHFAAAAPVAVDERAFEVTFWRVLAAKAAIAAALALLLLASPHQVSPPVGHLIKPITSARMPVFWLRRS